jgi:hypothetical protein
MEELWELRQALETGDLQAALAIVDEMEEMARDDKIQKIASYMRVLLVHKIKQAVEGRSAKSWEVSIRHALRQIATVNKRRKAGGWYLNDDDLSGLLAEVYTSALDWASLEVYEGIHSAAALATMHDQEAVRTETFSAIKQAQQGQLP